MTTPSRVLFSDRKVTDWGGNIQKKTSGESPAHDGREGGGGLDSLGRIGKQKSDIANNTYVPVPVQRVLIKAEKDSLTRGRDINSPKSARNS